MLINNMPLSEFFFPFVEYTFLKKAMVASIVLSFSAAPLGVFLVLKKLSLVGDALSHSILPGVALGYFIFGFSLPAMSIGGFLAGIAVIFFSGWVTRRTNIKQDTSFASFYLMSLSIGVLLISAKGSQMDLMHVLFGNLLAIDNAVLFLIGSIASLTLLFIAYFYRVLVLESFDPDFFQLHSNFLTRSVPWLFMGLIVFNLVASFHAIGTLLSLGLIILPSATATLWSKKLPTLISISLLISVLCCYLGIVASYHFNLSIGPTIVLLIGVIYIFSLVRKSSKP